MDQQITAVIVNRKEHKLEVNNFFINSLSLKDNENNLIEHSQKGCGYHLDLLIVLIMIVICSVFGLPW